MLKNFVEESCIGTGDLITLTGATVGNITFLKSLKTGQYINYVIEDLSTSVKVSGIGLFNAANNTILRSDRWQFDGTNVIDNPISNITLSGATNRIRCDITAESTEILSRIDDSITATAKAVYIYDTSKDIIDWRHNENASWYNEPLNTATRGATREFPAVVLIVATDTEFTIYDATQTDLPMWMVFSKGAGLLLHSAASSTEPIVGISAVDGVITVAIKSNSTARGGIFKINFALDSSDLIRTIAQSSGIRAGGIAERNNAAYFYPSNLTGGALVSNEVTGVIALRSTYQENPIIYVETQSGLTRIASDGSVSNWLGGANTAVAYVNSLTIIDGYVYFAVDAGAPGKHINVQSINLPLVDSTYASSYRKYVSQSGLIWGANMTPVYYGATNSSVRRLSYNTIATNRGLVKIKPNPTAYGLGLHATITSKFNSGYQYGDIKGAWLADTVAGAVTGGTVADRSYNNNGLTVNGTLTKTPVNTGCELVGFSGFGTGNTLTTTRSLAGSDLYLSCWFKGNASAIGQYAVSAGDTGISGAHRAIAVLGNEFSLVLWGTALDLRSGILQQDGVWAKVDATINNTTGECEIFVNGRSAAKAIRTLTAFTSTAVSVGMRNDVAGYFTSDLALVRISATIPTKEQIAYAYNQEKHLFNQNTACTLAGTSDDCVDVDYDSDTGLHHVATTTNKSVFKGLVRVSSKVGAFTTVSAQNDYVAEG